MQAVRPQPALSGQSEEDSLDAKVLESPIFSKVWEDNSPGNADPEMVVFVRPGRASEKGASQCSGRGRDSNNAHPRVRLLQGFVSLTPYSWSSRGSAVSRSGYESACKDFVPNDLEVQVPGRVFLVTGGNSSIGKATALEIAKRDGFTEFHQVAQFTWFVEIKPEQKMPGVRSSGER
ncbi:hypothetical protein P7K49_000438 [Saguinus oedipus]|uniref:Uncharacterized protein n=1 Tax=Saguinus oedipus TaxID=9490 RepID=A0ABQ9WBS7_SAGOE|nr:hypothetical protein P7K49_000438 [Saguinus oedipus]